MKKWEDENAGTFLVLRRKTGIPPNSAKSGIQFDRERKVSHPHSGQYVRMGRQEQVAIKGEGHLIGANLCGLYDLRGPY